jgi:nicotinate-nucleotide pyrophosphorylase (carboxylating)
MPTTTTTERDRRFERALFRGDQLSFENNEYRRAFQGIVGALMESDAGAGDLTAKSLDLADRPRRALILAREAGIVAGLQEIGALLEGSGLQVSFEKSDGEPIQPDDILLRAEGGESRLLLFERIGLNLLQRMSGIATAGRCLQQRVSGRSSARVVGTRKTPWGWLDKRALHVAGCGTHRLGLGDAILIKNNHLALVAAREEDAAPIAVQRAWKHRDESAFIEVEVRSEASARAAAQVFRKLRGEAGEDYPCLIMLDNMTPAGAEGVVRMLHNEGLWEDTLIEVSGGVSEATIGAYAASGVDAISVGALTHSPRALDISQKIS